MSILNHVPSGGLLAKPTGLKTRCQVSEGEYRERIVDSLLPVQKEFVEDSKTLLLGMVAGFGAGKTRSLCAKICLDAMDNPGTVMAVLNPPHPLRDVNALTTSGGWRLHDFRISPQPESTDIALTTFYAEQLKRGIELGAKT